MQSITQKGQMCYNCFQERESAEGPCPHCGFDLAENEKKYPVALRAGTILNGRYIVGRVLGQGGFGITYLALDTQLNAKVAIKEFMPGELATRVDGTTVSVLAESKTEAFTYGAERFQEEARTLAKFIGNPNIAAVTSYFDENDTSYFVMDYIEGISFKTYIANHGGRVSVEDTLNVMIPVLRALTAVHQEGFIHRDVTPDNIYITKDGMVKLLDFGSARYSIGDKSKSLDVILKVGYAPKEQYIRRSRQGPFTDVYSCAACFYAALTGFLPPESLERLDHDELVPVSQCGIEIPEYLDKAILKGLAVQPEDRFQNAEEFLEAIENQQVVEVSASQTAAAQPGKKKVKPALIAGIAAVVVLLAAVGAFFGSGGEEEAGEDAPPLHQAEVPAVTIAGQEYSTDERELDLENQGLTDADIQDIRYMVNLTSLNLNGNAITDLTPLSSLAELRTLRLRQTDISDLSPIAGLTNLEYLELEDNRNLVDFSPLKGLSNLRTLYCFGSLNTVSDLSFLAGLTNLQELQVNNAMGITDLSPLAGLTNLRSLYINGDGSGSNAVVASDLDAFAALTNLQTLGLHVSGLEDLSALENLTQLQNLTIYGTQNSPDLTPLGSLTNLQELQISCSGQDEGIFAENLSFLSNLHNLTYLRLDISGLKSFQGLEGLTNLTNLMVGGDFYITDLSPMSGLTKLRDVYLGQGGNSFGLEDFTALSGLTSLESLTIDADAKSLKGLETLTHLKTLNLYGSRLYTDLSPLSTLAELETLYLPNGNAYGMQPLDTSGLEQLTSLRQLSLFGDMTSFDFLRSLQNLQTLEIYNWSPNGESVPSLAPLGELSNLTSLTVYCSALLDDLSFFQGLTNLRSAAINLDRDGPVHDLEPLRNLTNLTSLEVMGSECITDWSAVEHVPNVSAS